MGSKVDYIARTHSDIEGEDKWYDIGVAFQNGNGSIAVNLDALPLSGEIKTAKEEGITKASYTESTQFLSGETESSKRK